MPDVQFSHAQLQTFVDEIKPAELNDNQLNGILLADYLKRNNLAPTVANLHKAKDALVNALDWKVKPVAAEPAPPPTKAEVEAELSRRQQNFDATESKRREQEVRDNNEASFWERQKQFDVNQKAENDKRVAEVAEQELRSAILSVEFYRSPNRIDHGRSEAVRNELFKIVAKTNGKRDAKLTLKLVREVINALPDDATPTSVLKLVEEKNRELQKPKVVRRDSLGYL